MTTLLAALRPSQGPASRTPIRPSPVPPASLWRGLIVAFTAAGAILWTVADAEALAPDPMQQARPPRATTPEWKVMDYGPFLSLTAEVAKGNIANKGIAIRLDPGEDGVAQGQEFFLFETDTLRAAAAWTGPQFIDWKNIAFDGTHEVHPSTVGNTVFINPDAPGWADGVGRFDEQRVRGRDGHYYGPLPSTWGHWRGLYVHGQQVVLSYLVGETEILESPGAEGEGTNRAVSRTFNIGPRSRSLVLQIAQGTLTGTVTLGPEQKSHAAFLSPPGTGGASTNAVLEAAVLLLHAPENVRWATNAAALLRLEIPAGGAPIRFKLLYTPPAADCRERVDQLARTSPIAVDLKPLLLGGPAQWSQSVTTKVERVVDARQPYQVEGISVPFQNPYRSWMRVSAFDFFGDQKRAAVSTWQGDVWVVDGLGGTFGTFTWKRIAAGLFQPLGLKIVRDAIYVTCRDQLTILRDLNGDGETDFYENFNNDAQVTEHFHEFAMDLQTDASGNFYYAKGGRHAKDALVPQHGTLLRVSPDGAKTEIVASGFRAPNGFCLNDDGTFVVSDQEGHWTPENRLNWVKPGGFYGYMMGYHEGRSPDDFEQPAVWVHKSVDRSPAEPLWVASDQWGVPRGALISLSYGTGKILGVLHESVQGVTQGGVFVMPIPAMATGIMRGRFHPGDGQLYTAGLFGWAGDKTRPGGFYRVRSNGKRLVVPVALHATARGMVITFSGALNPESAADPQNYAVSRWEYRRTAEYGSDDYKISQKGQRGRDTVALGGAQVAEDHRSVLLQIPDMQPCAQMEIKYNLQSADGLKVSQFIQNTVHVLGPDLPLDGKR